jgi:hypothetical protein
VRRIPFFHAVADGNRKHPSPGVLRLGDLGAQDDERAGAGGRSLASSPIPSQFVSRWRGDSLSVVGGASSLRLLTSSGLLPVTTPTGPAELFA